MNTSECITNDIVVPHPALTGEWDSIVISDRIRDQILNHALLALTLRRQLAFSATALHGLILLYGPPGTGKTTLARALAQQLAPLTSATKARLIEVNPHGLMSAEHGQSQQRVIELLCEEIPGRADDKLPTIVVLDEVESMAVARGAASLEANPADVHRATDAVLTALDRNAREHPHLLVVATSNFTEALDTAFVSRADVAVEVPLPDGAAILTILQRTLGDFAVAYPTLGKLRDDPRLRAAATALVGLDGRQIRKTLTDALAQRRETVVDPSKLTVDDIVAVGKTLHETRGGSGRAAA